MKKTKFILLPLITFSLYACSAHKPSQNVTDLDPSQQAAAEISQTEAYALQQNPVFSGEIKRNPNGEIINPLVAPANQTYYFAFDSNAVKSSDYEAILVQAKYLAAHPEVKIRLEGNTDSRGSREYNIALGWRRDQAVEKVLEQYGVSANQINMVSYGKERPALDENNNEAWALNRRVNLVYEASSD